MINSIKFTKSIRNSRLSRYIFVSGIITLISNSFLVILLSILPVSFSTLCSQLLHNVLGYYGSSSLVFLRRGSKYRYCILVLISWFLQWRLLLIIIGFGIENKIAVISIIPLMALFSFLSQRFIVFREKDD